MNATRQRQNGGSGPVRSSVIVSLCLCLAGLVSAPAFPSIVSPPVQESAQCEQCATAQQGLNALMNGDPDAAIEIFHQIETRAPESPLGYLLEADATWWKIYLTTADLIDPDVFDVVDSKTSSYDAHFEELIDSAIRKSEARIHAHEGVPRNKLYEGLAYALRARFYGLRDQDLPTARAAKKMRTLLLAAQSSDPSLADADAGIGLYNYFVDTLPTIVKMLKFLIGLPGGSRELGLQQLQLAAEKGDLVRAEAKFYLAKDYSRPNEREYSKSLRLFQELSQEFPRNLLWKLLVGSLEIRLDRASDGEALYREVMTESAGEGSDVTRALHHAAESAMKRLNRAAEKEKETGK